MTVTAPPRTAPDDELGPLGPLVVTAGYPAPYEGERRCSYWYYDTDEEPGRCLGAVQPGMCVWLDLCPGHLLFALAAVLGRSAGSDAAAGVLFAAGDAALLAGARAWGLPAQAGAPTSLT